MDNKNFKINNQNLKNKSALSNIKKTVTEKVKLEKIPEIKKSNVKELSIEDLQKSDFTLKYAMEIYINKKDIDLSIRVIHKSLEINPNNDKSFYNLGLLYAEKNEHSKSIENLKKCLNINPNNESARFNLANEFIKANDIDSSISEYQTILENQPNSEDTLYNLAFCYMNFKKDYEKAIEVFKKLLNFNPIHVNAYFNLAVSYYLIGEKEKAAETYNNLILFFPDYSTAYYNLATIYHELGRKDKAVLFIKKYLDIPKEFSEYLLIKKARRRLKEWKEEGDFH